MATELHLPSVIVEAEPEARPGVTLGADHRIASRLSVGRSDAVAVVPADVIGDTDVANYIERREDALVLVRLTLRVSFRPAEGERFERALFSVILSADNPDYEAPFARLLLPDRLASGPFLVKRGFTVGMRAGVPGLELDAEASSTTQAHTQRCYVIAAGVGESDPEWRYTRTETMELEGSHEMALVAEVRRGAPAEAHISVNATVARGRRRTDVVWEPQEHIARVPLPSD